MQVEHAISRRRERVVKLVSASCPDRTVQAIFLFLMTVSVMLVIGHLVMAAANQSNPGQATRLLRDFFGLEREGNLPNWYSSLQLALIGLVCGVNFLAERLGEAAGKYRMAWLGLLGLFLFLSLDEGAQVHERLDEIVAGFSHTTGRAVSNGQTEEASIYFYLLLYVPGFVVVSAGLIGFFFSRVKDRATRGLFVAGLVGFALKLGLDAATPWVQGATWLGPYTEAAAVMVEVSVFIVAQTLLLTALLNYSATLIKRLLLPMADGRLR